MKRSKRQVSFKAPFYVMYGRGGLLLACDILVAGASIGVWDSRGRDECESIKLSLSYPNRIVNLVSVRVKSLMTCSR